MNKKLIFSMLLLLTLSATGYAIEAPQINMSLLNQEPDPVGPGSYVELRFSVANLKTGTVAEGLEVELVPTYPFTLDTNENAVRVLGDLPALGDRNVAVLRYKVRVDDKAVDGTNIIKIKYRHNNLDWITREFYVNIRTLDANVGIVSVTTNPEMIKPGEEVILRIKVKNLADSAMRDVTMKLDLTFSTFLSRVAALTASDSLIAFNALPFAPLDSATEQQILLLKPGEEHIFTYTLITYSDAESRVYKLPIVFEYRDILQTRYSKQDVIGLIVGTKPEISVVIDETDLYVGKRSGSVTIRFINKGFSDIKFLDVILAETEDYELLSAEEVYIGNVDSDDYETADFDIYLKNGATAQEKSIVLPLRVNYRDANNNIYEELMNLTLKVYNSDKLGIEKSSSLPLLLVILAIGGFVVWFLRRKRKK